MLSRNARRHAATLVAVALCACDAESPDGPDILVDICTLPTDDEDGGFEQCSLAFGEVDVAASTVRRAVLTNDSDLPLTLINVQAIGDPAFRIEDFPDTVAARASADIVVSVRPTGVANVLATLFVLSDAENTPQTTEGNSEVRIDLSAVPVDDGLPDVDVEPLACDFGDVAVGATASCGLTVSNVGVRDLILDSATFGDSCDLDCAFVLVTIVAQTVIATGSSATLNVELRPTAVGEVSATLAINCNDVDESPIAVALSGEGVP